MTAQLNRTLAGMAQLALREPSPCGVGIDLVEVASVSRHIRAAGKRYVQRMLTAAEVEFCADDHSRIASRIAAKEAVVKALGCGFRGGVQWHDVTIHRAVHGEPSVVLSGRAQAHARARGVQRIVVSLTHEGGYAAAIAIATKDGASQ